MFNQRNPKDAVVPDDIKNQMRRESTILCSLNHPNVIKIFGYCPAFGWIIMERAKEVPDTTREKRPDNSELTRAAATAGVAYLHSPKLPSSTAI